MTKNKIYQKSVTKKFVELFSKFPKKISQKAVKRRFLRSIFNLSTAEVCFNNLFVVKKLVSFAFCGDFARFKNICSV